MRRNVEVAIGQKGLLVQFPFQPYDLQKDYMTTVVQALDEGENALLESPTGTGKTVSLLCSTLAWQSRRRAIAHHQGRGAIAYEMEELRWSQGATVPAPPGSHAPHGSSTIIYASRTHGQLSQVARELKRTAYTPKISLLGSREQLCVHREVSKLKGAAMNAGCSALTKGRMCSHKLALEEKSGLPDSNQIMDIEELANLGRRGGFCPYFLSRDMTGEAEIILMPYNYLLDSATRRSLQINWNDSIVIIDEAHNLETVASDAASFELTSLDIAGALGEVQTCIAGLKKDIQDGVVGADHSAGGPPGVSRTAMFYGVADILVSMEKILDSFDLGGTAAKGRSEKGEFIYQFFALAGVTYESAAETQAAMNECATYYASLLPFHSSVAPYLEDVLRCFRLCFRGAKTLCLEQARFYRVHIGMREIQQQEKRRASRNGATGDSYMIPTKKVRMLCYWCFCPGVAMEELKRLGVRSILLTSGTLGPLPALAVELRVPFKYRLENPHIIEKNQAWIGVCKTGPTSHSLCSAYQERDTPAYKRELGNALVNFCRLVPGGLLVFFPTYSVMDNCIKSWQQEGQWGRMRGFKEPLQEPRAASELNALLKAYDDAIAQKGAVLFAVCRGKLSEGVDFSDDKARCVIVTGLPFAPTMDPKVNLKKKYMDEVPIPKGCERLSGNEWYSQSAARAVNQAIGRVVRHRLDYGSVILLDRRFADEKNQKNLSVWAKPFMSNTGGTFDEIQRGLTAFYKAIANNPRLAIMPEPEKQPIRIIAPHAQKETGLAKAAVAIVSRANCDEGASYISAPGLQYVAELSAAEKEAEDAKEEERLAKWKAGRGGERKKEDKKAKAAPALTLMGALSKTNPQMQTKGSFRGTTGSATLSQRFSAAAKPQISDKHSTGITADRRSHDTGRIAHQHDTMRTESYSRKEGKAGTGFFDTATPSPPLDMFTSSDNSTQSMSKERKSGPLYDNYFSHSNDSQTSSNGETSSTDVRAKKNAAGTGTARGSMLQPTVPKNDTDIRFIKDVKASLSQEDLQTFREAMKKLSHEAQVKSVVRVPVSTIDAIVHLLQNTPPALGLVKQFVGGQLGVFREEYDKVLQQRESLRNGNVPSRSRIEKTLHASTLHASTLHASTSHTSTSHTSNEHTERRKESSSSSKSNDTGGSGSNTVFTSFVRDAQASLCAEDIKLLRIQMKALRSGDVPTINNAATQTAVILSRADKRHYLHLRLATMLPTSAHDALTDACNRAGLNDVGRNDGAAASSNSTSITRDSKSTITSKPKHGSVTSAALGKRKADEKLQTSSTTHPSTGSAVMQPSKRSRKLMEAMGVSVKSSGLFSQLAADEAQGNPLVRKSVLIAKDRIPEGTSEESDCTCCICTEMPAEPCRAPCGHIACLKCWLNLQKSKGQDSKCPCCRKDIDLQSCEGFLRLVFKDKR